MSQDWNTDLYDKDARSADAIMQDVEKMFDALQSSFFGGAAPSNPVAGKWWVDTSANLLKLRNEANNAWLDIWDLANNKPVITNLSNEITVAMVAASAKDPAVGTAGLRTLGTWAVQAAAGNDSRFETVADNHVHLGKMQHGSIMLPYVMSEDETMITTNPPGSYTWVDADVDKLRIYVPADATTLRASVLAYANALQCAARFKVSTLTSSEVTVNSASPTWYTTMTLDVSSLSGWYDILWQVNSGTTGKAVYICAFSFIWE